MITLITKLRLRHTVSGPMILEFLAAHCFKFQQKLESALMKKSHGFVFRYLRKMEGVVLIYDYIRPQGIQLHR